MNHTDIHYLSAGREISKVERAHEIYDLLVELDVDGKGCPLFSFIEKVDPSTLGWWNFEGIAKEALGRSANRKSGAAAEALEHVTNDVAVSATVGALLLGDASTLFSKRATELHYAEFGFDPSFVPPKIISLDTLTLELELEEAANHEAGSPDEVDGDELDRLFACISTVTAVTEELACLEEPKTRLSADAALANARLHHDDWYWLFESRSNLAVPGAVDLEVVAELVDTAPNEFLAGFVLGLAQNSR